MKTSRLALAILCLLSAVPVISAESGLFHTPAERVRVTAERLSLLAKEAQAGAPPQTLIAPDPAESSKHPDSADSPVRAGPPRLNGVSLKQDSRAYAWIAGRRYQDGDLISGQRVRVLHNGVQLVGVNGPGRLYRIGEVIEGVARE